jgi:hypothetical protein
MNQETDKTADYWRGQADAFDAAAQAMEPGSNRDWAVAQARLARAAAERIEAMQAMPARYWDVVAQHNINVGRQA